MILHKLHKFCPECQSVMIRREHRGFIQKYLFRQKPKYWCGNCQIVFFTPLLEKDINKINEENYETNCEKKPKINLSLEEICEIVLINDDSNKDENLKARLDVSEGKFKREFQSDFSTEFERGFQKGFQKGFEKGFQRGLEH